MAAITSERFGNTERDSKDFFSKGYVMVSDRWRREEYQAARPETRAGMIETQTSGTGMIKQP